jgi:hypothetical protein
MTLTEKPAVDHERGLHWEKAAVSSIIFMVVPCIEEYKIHMPP